MSSSLTGKQCVADHLNCGVIDCVVRGLGVSFEKLNNQLLHGVALQKCKDDGFNNGDHDSKGVAILFRVKIL